MTTELPFRFFDCDNHYYEALDAFTRYIEPEYRKRAMQWAVIDGKTRLLVGGKVNRFIPNPTFDPVAAPGVMDEYFRGRNPKGADARQLFGQLEPIRPEYRDRDARLAVMDAQGMEGASCCRRSASAWSRRCTRPARADGGVPRLQPVAGGGLGLRLPGPDLRRPLHHAVRPGQRGTRAGVGPGTTTPASS